MKPHLKIFGIAVTALLIMGWIPWGNRVPSVLAQRSGCESCLSVKCYSRVHIQGRVLAVNHPVAVVETSEGERYHVRLGPYWFWKEKGYSLKEGTEVEISGFVRGQLVFPTVIRTPQGLIRLRDERGVPLFRRSWRRCW